VKSSTSQEEMSKERESNNENIKDRKSYIRGQRGHDKRKGMGHQERALAFLSAQQGERGKTWISDHENWAGRTRAENVVKKVTSGKQC